MHQIANNSLRPTLVISIIILSNLDYLDFYELGQKYFKVSLYKID